MDLLYVAPSAYLLGGVQDWLADLVAGQRALGHRVRVAVPDDTIHRLAPYAERYPGLEPIAFRNRSGSNTGRLQALTTLLRQHPDHLVVGVNIAALYPALRTLRRQGTFRGKVVMSLHALEAAFYADLRAQRDLLDGVVATNQLSRFLAMDLGGIEPARALLAPYGVDVAESAPPAPAEEAVEGLAIVWVGRLERDQKRVQDLLPILQALDAEGLPFTFTIAGDGPERPSLEQELAPWRDRGVLHFTGAIPRTRLRQEVYRPGRVLLITSRWETGPIVAWEAFAAGMAVVSSRFVGSGLEQALVEERTALLFETGDAPAAARQLVRLQDRGQLAELAARGAALVRSRYSRQASLTAWMDALTTIDSLPALPLPSASPPPAAAGSLDRLLGTARADAFRSLVGRRFVHREAGSEWPHSGHAPGGNDALLERAAQLDRHG